MTGKAFGCMTRSVDDTVEAFELKEPIKLFATGLHFGVEVDWICDQSIGEQCSVTSNSVDSAVISHCPLKYTFHSNFDATAFGIRRSRQTVTHKNALNTICIADYKFLGLC